MAADLSLNPPDTVIHSFFSHIVLKGSTLHSLYNLTFILIICFVHIGYPHLQEVLFIP
jgi:hypothetical protein